MVSMKFRSELLLRGFAALLAVPGIAAAQTAGRAPVTEAAQPTAPATAQQAEPVSLEEIVVTAQRRAENLQDVPITVTAVSAQVLAAAGVTNTADLVNVVPGLTMPTSAGYTLPHLRGIGS